MKRLLVLLFVVAFLVAIPLTHFAGKNAKVEICHLNSANDILDVGFFAFYYGKVISVSVNAVPALEAHGDSRHFAPFPDWLRDLMVEWWGMDLPNADCVFLAW